MGNCLPKVGKAQEKPKPANNKKVEPMPGSNKPVLEKMMAHLMFFVHSRVIDNHFDVVYISYACLMRAGCSFQQQGSLD